jgi:SAM-dependent methyltransferase
MFTNSQQFYDAIYEWKDYNAECSRLIEFIARYKKSPGNALLDVACGTGGHIPYLREAYAVEGLDLDQRMLEIARSKHPGIPFHRGDMVDFDLGRQFDVVVSLFSSIGYVRTNKRLALAVRNMARHVRPGGVLIIEPFFSPAAWKPRIQAPGANIVDKPDITIVRMIDWVREGNLVKSLFHYLVGTASSVEHFTEAHEMGLFTDEEYRTSFASVGLPVTHDEKGLMGRGLYIGRQATPVNE